MKQAVLCLAALAPACCTAAAADPRLRIEPDHPQPGGTILVTYDRRAGPLEKSDMLTLVYGFSQFQIQRTPLQSKGTRFVAEIQVPSDAVYFWCWVEGKSDEEKDTNRGGVWDTYLYNNRGIPVEGARRERAFVYQLRKQPLDANTVSLILLEEELRSFPANGVARAEWWSLRYNEAGQTTAAKDAILREIGQFYDSNLEKPWAYRAAALGYNRLQRNPQAVDVMRAFLKRFPEDASQDQQVLFFFQNWGSLAEMEGLPQASRRWLKNAAYWSGMLGVYERSKAGPEKLLQAGREWLALVPKEKDADGEARSTVAEAWLSSGVDPAAAEAIAREAVAISEIGPKPHLLATSPANRKMERGFIVDVRRSTLGWALFQQGRYEVALRELERAVAVREKEKITTRALDYRLGRTLEKLGRPTEAMDAYMKELAFGALPDPTRAAIAGLYQKLHGGLDGLQSEIRARVNELLANAASEGAAPIEDANEKLGRFELRGADGQPVEMSRYRGKIVLIEFWATWCGACLKSMEHTQKLAQAFPGQMVVLAVSQDEEETRSRAPEYLKKKGYDFVLLFDDERRRDLRVSFVPARFLLDRNGIVRVREFGWSNAWELVFERKLRGLIGEGTTTQQPHARI